MSYGLLQKFFNSPFVIFHEELNFRLTVFKRQIYLFLWQLRLTGKSERKDGGKALLVVIKGIPKWVLKA